MKIRRDSTVSELDERLKEAKLTNKKFRKQLLQKDSELQVSFPFIKLSNGITTRITSVLQTYYTDGYVTQNHLYSFKFCVQIGF